MGSKKDEKTMPISVVRTNVVRLLWISAVFFTIIGMIIGIFIGYYTLPHISYDVTIEAGEYTFDVGPTAAKLIGDSAPPEVYSASSEQTIDSGNIDWDPSKGPRVLIGPNNGLPCCYPKECEGLYDDVPVCDNSCIYPVACYREPTDAEILNRSIKFCADIDMEPNATMVDATGSRPCVEWVRDIARESLIKEQ